MKAIKVNNSNVRGRSHSNDTVPVTTQRDMSKGFCTSTVKAMGRVVPVLTSRRYNPPALLYPNFQLGLVPHSPLCSLYFVLEFTGDKRCPIQVLKVIMWPS